MKLFTIIHNFFFCLKYPFWKATNVWTGEFMGYEFTWYDDIPYGWRKAFGKEMSKELKSVGKAYLKKHKDKKWSDILSWQQIKEKYGSLRLYASAIDPIQNILTRYEVLSIGYCINCGKPARYRTSGWIEYLCDDCIKNYSKVEAERLSEKDIPESYTYDYQIINEQSFDTENDRDKVYSQLEELDTGFIYNKKEVDGKYKIITLNEMQHRVDYKEKYDIDFEEIWGLK